ncbi:MAG: GNAT family N-acetyltransferase [Rhodobacteraceae bacterium]|nr:GNAT family N-acetyltransferase [Paracoccaceae bacterium]
MTAIPTILTERLKMRGPTLSDLGVYAAFNAASDVRVGKYRSGKTDSEVLAVLKEDIEHWQRYGYGMWLLERQLDGTIIGGCGLVHPSDWPRHELTWWLMPGEQGSGYATEASLAAISFGYNTLGWPAVETYMRDENISARRLVNRLGGQKIEREKFPDGVTRDVFALPVGVSEASVAQ